VEAGALTDAGPLLVHRSVAKGHWTRERLSDATGGGAVGLSLALPSIAAQQFRHGREAEWEAVGGKILIGRLRVSLQEGPLWGARTER